MILRPACPDDAPALADLGREAFVTAFAHLYRDEDLQPFLAKTYSHEAVAADIRDPQRPIRLAVDADGMLAGFCKLSLACGWPQHARAGRVVELKQLYTDPARTGQGIGAALMDWALAEARGRGAEEMQISVWSENYGAQRFYGRYGFAKLADIDFWVGNHRDHEFLYACLL